jgi:DNA-directed RNA polymerase subunit RPC12/RpoP
MGKISKHTDKHIKFYKCEVCLKNIPIEYYFTVGDSITCTDCGTEYVLQSKSPLELTRQAVDYSNLDFDEPY